MENIKVLKINIKSDNDFYWNSSSYPRGTNNYGDLEDTVVVYLNNPNTLSIVEVLVKFAKEFRLSFESDREYLNEVRDKIVRTLLKSMRKCLKNKENINVFYSEGNYGIQMIYGLSIKITLK